MIPQYCIAHPYCARFSRHWYARERVHLHNEGNFPQAKLDSEINFRFPLNDHGGFYNFLHNNSVHINLFNLKGFEKNSSDGKNKHYVEELTT